MRDCENVLKIEGPADEIQRFKELAKDIFEDGGGNKDETALSFARLLPVPKELKDNLNPDSQTKAYFKEKYGFEDRWDWCVENWGSDQDIIAELFDDEFRFTANDLDPPVKAIISISKQFPGITFHFSYRNYIYDDDRLADVGDLVIRGGSIVSESTKEMVKCVFCAGCRRVTGYEH